MSPSVSIIVPTYNRAHMLDRCLASIQQQTFTDWELLVVDDGSSDNTVEIVERWQRTDSRIRLIRQPVNKGVSHARNTGVNAASGEWVAFNDSDDEWIPEKLERQLARVDQIREHENRESVLIYGWYRTQHTDGWSHCHNESFDGMVRSNLLRYFFASFITLMVKRSVYQEIGGLDTELLRGEDHDFLLRVSRRYPFDVLRETVSIAHRHEGPSLTTQNEYYRPYIDRYRQDFLEEGGRQLLAFYLTLEAKLFLAQKQYGRTCRICLESLFVYPFSRNTWRMLAGAAMGPSWRKFKSQLSVHPMNKIPSQNLRH